MRPTQELEQEIRACPDPAVHGMTAALTGPRLDKEGSL